MKIWFRHPHHVGMVRMPKPKMCLYGEDAYMVNVPTRQMYLSNEMVRVRVFMALSHLLVCAWVFPDHDSK